MGRKVFISFLGTNNYLETIYTIGDYRSSVTRFIQEALIDRSCKDWTEEDHIYIFCTKEAQEKNWLDNGQPNGSIGLGHVLESMKNRVDYPIRAGYEMVPIPECFSSEEIWELFGKVYRQLQPGDEVYYDITHAFRSIPMLSTILFNYAKNMKGITVVDVAYGAFEKLGPAYKVKDWPIEDRVAPIVDMTDLVRLQDYVEMSNSINHYGRMDLLAERLKKEPELTEIADTMEILDNALTCCMGDDIRTANFKTHLEQNKKKINKSSMPQPAKELVAEVMRKISGFKPNGDIENLLEAAHWAINHKMVAQAYTLGKEYINRVAEVKLRSRNPYPKGKMQKINYLGLLNSLMSCDETEDEIDYNEYSEFVENLKNEFPWLVEMQDKYHTFNEYRNAFAHSKSGYDFEDMKDYFEKNFDLLVSIVKNAPKAEKKQ